MLTNEQRDEIQRDIEVLDWENEFGNREFTTPELKKYVVAQKRSRQWLKQQGETIEQLLAEVSKWRELSDGYREEMGKFAAEVRAKDAEIERIGREHADERAAHNCHATELIETEKALAIAVEALNKIRTTTPYEMYWIIIDEALNRINQSQVSKE